VTPRSAYQPSKLSQRLSAETVSEIIAAYQAGATTREVGARFGLAHSSVNKLLKNHGVTARRRGPSGRRSRDPSTSTRPETACASSPSTLASVSARSPGR
jgi:hypothetical protein